MENLSKKKHTYVFHKKTNTYEDVEFHNSMQEWVFTTVYQL